MVSTISTGEPSTLGTYRKIALALSAGNEEAKAVKYFDDKIKECQNGEDEEVIHDERQMIYLIGQLVLKDMKK